MLRVHGYVVHATAGPEEAHDVADDVFPDVVLFDMNALAGDPLQRWVHQLRARCGDTPIVIGMASDAVHDLSEHVFDRVVTKPFTSDEIDGCIRDWLARRAA